MAVTGREMSDGDGGGVSRLPRRFGLAAYFVVFGLASVAIYIVIGAAVDWAQIRIDDIRYGRPRTVHVEGYVGHGPETAGRPTRFVGLNLARQVVVVEIPGGDATLVRSLPGPYLFGAHEDLVPVLLSLNDIDGDGLDDLVVNVRNEQILYLNRDGGFRLPTPEEQQQIVQELGS